MDKVSDKCAQLNPLFPFSNKGIKNFVVEIKNNFFKDFIVYFLIFYYKPYTNIFRIQITRGGESITKISQNFDFFFNLVFKPTFICIKFIFTKSFADDQIFLLIS